MPGHLGRAGGISNGLHRSKLNQQHIFHYFDLFYPCEFHEHDVSIFFSEFFIAVMKLRSLLRTGFDYTSGWIRTFQKSQSGS